MDLSFYKKIRENLSRYIKNHKEITFTLEEVKEMILELSISRKPFVRLLIERSEEAKEVFKNGFTEYEFVYAIKNNTNFIRPKCECCGDEITFDDDHYFYPKTCRKESCKYKISSIRWKNKSLEEKNKYKEECSKRSCLRRKDVREKRTKNQLDKSYEELFIKWSNVEPAFTREEWKGYGKNILYKWKCKHCGLIFENYAYIRTEPICKNCIPEFSSLEEFELIRFVEEIVNKDNIKIRDKIIKPFELDIWIPSQNVGIEYDGLYFHREEHKDKKGTDYHTRKFLAAQKANIDMIQVLDSEWNHINSKKAIKSFIERLLNPKNMTNFQFKEVIEINYDEALTFINENSYWLEYIPSPNSKYFKLIDINDINYSVLEITNKNELFITNSIKSKTSYLNLNKFKTILSKGEYSILIENRYRNKKDIADLKNIGFLKTQEIDPEVFYFKGKKTYNVKNKEDCINILKNKYDENKDIYENMIDNNFFTFKNSGYLKLFIKI